MYVCLCTHRWKSEDNSGSPFLSLFSTFMWVLGTELKLFSLQEVYPLSHLLAFKLPNNQCESTSTSGKLLLGYLEQTANTAITFKCVSAWHHFFSFKDLLFTRVYMYV